MDTEYTYNLTAEQVQTINTALNNAGETIQEQIDAYRSAGGALALGWWNNPELSRKTPEGVQFGYELILGIAHLPPKPEPAQVIMEPGDAGEVLERWTRRLCMRLLSVPVYRMRCFGRLSLGSWVGMVCP